MLKRLLISFLVLIILAISGTTLAGDSLAYIYKDYSNMQDFYNDGHPDKAKFAQLTGNHDQDSALLIEILEILNREMMDLYGMEDGFYKKTITVNGEVKKLNTEILKSRGLVVYGEPSGYNQQAGRYRYLGYSSSGSVVSNRYHPFDDGRTKFDFIAMKKRGSIVHDPLTTGKLRLERTSNWFQPRAPYTIYEEIEINSRDLYWSELRNRNLPQTENLLKASLMYGFKHLADDFKNGHITVENIVPGLNEDVDFWYESIAIVEPPTHFTWGTANMFRIEGSNAFYRTIPLMPLGVMEPVKPDLSVRIDRTSLPNNTKGGQIYTARVTYTLANDVDYKATARLGLEHNGHEVSSVHGQVVEFQPGESKTFTFSFTGVANTNSTLLARVWPVSPAEDKNWSNNRDEVVIPTEAKIDLAADLEWRDISVLPGKTVTLKGILINKGNTEQSTNYIWRIGDKTYGATNITLPAGARRSISINYKVPDYPTMIEYYLEVNPNRNRPSGESTWANNRTDTNDIEVKAEPSGTPGHGVGPILVD